MQQHAATPEGTAGVPPDRRGQFAGTVFATWVVLGLFLDGWAHNAGRPEDFWTPWHAVLYSGFVAAVAFFVAERRRRRRDGVVVADDPLVLAGFVTFGLAGLADAAWHTAFGVEEDVAALLSPSHLALMVGGLLLITGPLRAPLPPDPEQPWRVAGTVVAAVTLAVAVVGFFLQFASPFHLTHPEIYGPTGSEVAHLKGVTGILLTNALLVAGVAVVATRLPRPPAGSYLVVLGAPALLLSGLLAFRTVALAAGAVAAGLVLDGLAHRGAGRRTLLLTAPAILWPAWFAAFRLGWGPVGWPAEFWTGAVVLAVLTGWGLDALLRPGVAPAGPVAGVTPATPAVASPAVLLGTEWEVPVPARGAASPASGGFEG
jgi:hypothetical protein